MLELLSWLLPALSSLCCLGLAGLVLSRNPRHATNQQFALGMAALAIMEFGDLMAARAGTEHVYVFWNKVSLVGEIGLPAPWLAFSLTFGRSNPADYLARWRPMVIGLYAVSLICLGLLATGRFVDQQLSLQPAGFWFSILLLLTLTAAVANAEKTLRAADHRQRWRLKYFLLGNACILVFLIYLLSQNLLFSVADHTTALLLSTVIIIGCSLMTFSLVRHKLLDVDVFVSRYVVYNSITVLGVGAYLLAVGIAAQAIKSLGGEVNAYLGALFLVLCLLLMGIGLLSHDARKRVRAFIDRHFYHSKYDYRREWLELTARLSAKRTVDELRSALGATMLETFWIGRTVLWLYHDRERAYRVVQPEHARLQSIGLSPALIQTLKERDYPVAVDGAPDTASAIGEEDEHFLRSAGIATVVPLIAENQMIGVLGLSPRQNGTAFTHEDYDLMKTMAKQAAASCLNIALSQRLVASKELETFHALSTFLLHDLKNVVSMLSLVVANMHRNLENPEFRREALANLSQTVEKMTRLMARVSALAKTPEPVRVEVDLNALVKTVVAEVGPSVRAKIITDYTDLPAIRADADRIKTVVTNLILNAKEAMTDGYGEIRIATFVDGSAAAFSVSDTGTGISAEFLERRLFKPFATTKSEGFGIGLYQCKSIIEAHGGKIDVTSEVGRGSSFTCLIPLDEDRR